MTDAIEIFLIGPKIMKIAVREKKLNFCGHNKIQAPEIETITHDFGVQIQPDTSDF
ncbi:14872_t:CDS:2, partial [Funneliformis geosporum]